MATAPVKSAAQNSPGVIIRTLKNVFKWVIKVVFSMVNVTGFVKKVSILPYLGQGDVENIFLLFFK